MHFHNNLKKYKEPLLLKDTFLATSICEKTNNKLHPNVCLP